MPLLRLGPRAEHKQKRLERLRSGGSEEEAFLEACVEDARLLGSLELAGVAATWDEVRASRRGERAPVEVERLRRALAAVPREAPIDRGALRTWHAGVVGGASAWRATGRQRPQPPAPPERIEGRLEILETWLAGDSVARLRPVEAGALVLARLVEILPFEDGNGRVSRLALDHAIRQKGGVPPILAGGDGPRLQACLGAAFALDLQPLAALIEEGCERGLDVMIQALEGRA